MFPFLYFPLFLFFCGNYLIQTYSSSNSRFFLFLRPGKTTNNLADNQTKPVMDKLNASSFNSNVNAQAANDPALAGAQVVSNSIQGKYFDSISERPIFEKNLYAIL